LIHSTQPDKEWEAESSPTQGKVLECRIKRVMSLAMQAYDELEGLNLKRIIWLR
jgi:hypothetical protein